MKKSMILSVLIIILNFSYTFADYQNNNSQDIDIDYINKKIDNSFLKFEEKINKSQEKTYYFDKAMEDSYILLNKKNNLVEKYIISYLNNIFKEKYYERNKNCFDTWACYNYIIYTLWKIISDDFNLLDTYNTNDYRYNQMLDMLFYSYMKESLNSYIYWNKEYTRKILEAWLKDLDNHKYYDNYDFYVWHFSYILWTYFSEWKEQKEYLEIYEKFKNKKLNREEKLLPIHKSKICTLSEEYCINLIKKEDMPSTAYSSFYFQEYLLEGYY